MNFQYTPKISISQYLSLVLFLALFMVLLFKDELGAAGIFLDSQGYYFPYQTY